MGRELPQSAAQTAPSGMGPLTWRQSYRVNCKVSRTGKDGYPLSHGLRRARFPLLSLRDIFPRSGGSLSSQGGALGHLPVSANKAPPSGELAATSGSRLRGSAPSPGELANLQGLTERVKPLPFFRSLRPCSTWNNFTVRRPQWECAPYTRYTRPSLPDGR